MRKPELIEALIAGATVVTANDRLARFLKQAVADHLIAQGRTAWATPRALTLAALLDQQHDALCASGDPAAVRVMSSHEAEALWEKVIEGSIARLLRHDGRNEPLLQVRALAQLADDARGIVLRHRLAFGTAATPSRTASGELGLDAREFALWHEVYIRRLAELRAIDAAGLPDLIAAAWRRGAIAPPARVLFEGFDEFTPQARELIAALRAAGAEVREPDVRIETAEALSARAAAPAPHATRVVLEDARAEIERAAAWAAARIAEDPAQRIGIVVPKLEEHRQTVIDALDAMLTPSRMVLAAPDESGSDTELFSPNYNVSLGRPLAGWPLVNDALRLLRCTQREADWRDVSGVLRSPFFAHATDTERMTAAAVELWLRDHLPERFPLEEIGVGYRIVLGHLSGAEIAPKYSVSDPDFLGLRPGVRAQRLPSEWATLAAQMLAAVGWPGPRMLDVAERQTLDAWDDALRAVCGLDATLGPIPWSKCLTRLSAICHDIDFQPRAPGGLMDAPIQVLGVLEAAVLEFDALWVTGLDDESWPPAARPNPLLPIALQVEAITPGSSAAERLVHAQRITTRLLDAAPVVIVSSPAHEGEAEHRPSPLIAHLDARDPASLPVFTPIESHWALDQATEAFVDAPVPFAPGGASPRSARGGTGLITHQSQCPFRAFTQHRLGAKPLQQPRDATDAAARGSLVHDVLHRIWSELGAKSALDALDAAHLHDKVKHHVATAIEHAAREAPAQWPLRLKVLEHNRLVARIEEWLALEAQRAPFTVAETEQWHTLEIGGITLAGRIDRVDLVDGKPVYIDYKTGDVDWRKWLGARPTDPQLPLYAISGAVAGGAPAAGVLFAKVRVGDHAFEGVAAEAGLAPGAAPWPPPQSNKGPRSEAVKGALHHAPDWDGLQRYWRDNLTRLAAEFKAGVATVTPERDACRHCHLQMLCRIDELGGPEKSGSDTELSEGIFPEGGR